MLDETSIHKSEDFGRLHLANEPFPMLLSYIKQPHLYLDLHM